MDLCTLLLDLTLLLLLNTSIHSEPCPFNPLCTCIFRQVEITCIDVPFFLLPILPTDDIYHLSIIRSELGYLHNDSFRERKFSSIRLMHNKLTTIDSSAFKGTEHLLFSLDLSYNHLTTIPVLAIKKMHHLQWLSLQGNYITDIWTKDIMTLGSTVQLKTLILSNNRLTEINDAALVKLKSLFSLNVDNNIITDIKGKPFPPSLVTLSLSNNQLTMVPSYALSNLHNLVYLHLSGNLFHDIPRYIPIPVTYIEKLDLSNNLVISMPKHVFNSSFSIRDLHLEFNFIKNLSSATFNNLKIEKLSLSNNRLSSFPMDTFLGVESTLKILDVSYNLISDYPISFIKLTQLTHLFMRGNLMKHLPKYSFHFKNILEVLDLSDNLFTRIPTEALNSTKRLRKLSLQENVICQISKEDFRGWAHSLETLSLANNKLMQLSKDVFIYLPNLRELRLSYNPFNYVDPNFLFPLRSSLEMLELSSCFHQLGSFPQIPISDMSQLKWIQMDYNSLEFHNISFCLSIPKLLHCDLEGNYLYFGDNQRGIKSIHSHINTFLLANSDIAVITSNTFKSHPSVGSILLHNNKLKRIEEGAFKDMPRLHTVVLAHNQLTHIETRSFHNLSHLSNVFLQDNQLRTLSLNVFNRTGDAATPMYLNLSNNMIHTLIESFEYEEEEMDLEVRTLDLSHNRISVIYDEFFRPMGESLFNLLLSHNQLSNISLEVLSDAPLLQILMLDHNQLTSIPPDTFYGCPSLQIISLSHNRISEVPSELFSTLQYLRILDLGSNSLETLSGDCFDNTKLESINLSRNSLSVFPLDAFLNVSSTLTKLDVSYNNLVTVSGLNYLAMLQTLNLSSNSLHTLESNTFHGLIHLLHLDLSNNPISVLSGELFRPLEMLTSLNLGNTKISMVPTLSLPNLSLLKLSQNFLSNLSEQTFLSLYNIQVLDLSQNYFKTVPNHIWTRTPDLTHLDLSYNPVEVLSMSSFFGLRKLMYLDIRGLNLKHLEPEILHELRYLRTFKTNSYSAVRTFRLHELLAKSSALSVFWIEMDEPTLSHQLQWTFGVKLRELTVSGRHLTKIFPDAFLGLQTHKLTLKITNTSVRTLPDGLLKYLATVRYLTVDLRGNDLTTMTPEVLAINKPTANITTKHIIGGLMLEDNPWICSCDMLWLGEWMRRWMRETLRVHLLPIEAALNAHVAARRSACTTTNGKTQIPIIDLHNNHLNCQNSANSLQLLSMTIFSFIFTILKSIH